MRPGTSDGGDVQERLSPREERFARRDEALAAHGVSIPTGRGMRPLRTVGRRRPRWLASLVRLFR